MAIRATSMASGISAISTIPMCLPASTLTSSPTATSTNRSARCGITITGWISPRRIPTRACLDSTACSTSSTQVTRRPDSVSPVSRNSIFRWHSPTTSTTRKPACWRSTCSISTTSSATTGRAVECSGGPGSTGPAILPAGQGNLLLQFRGAGGTAVDNSLPPSQQTFYALPNSNATPAVVRTFKFDRLNGQWSINGQFLDCKTVRFAVTEKTGEEWILMNLSGDWTHPIHIHLEEHQIISRNRQPPSPVEMSRKDVTQLHPNERVRLFYKFRDWTGKYPIHCHNVVHEDHAMMALWHVLPQGDMVLTP